MRAAAKMLAQIGLVLFCIYLVAGGVSLMVAILQQFEWAGPMSVGGLSLLIAYLASFVFKDEIQKVG